MYGQTDQCMLIGLAPDADYYARVQVFNSAGRGPKGQWRIAKTAKFGKLYTVLPDKSDSDVKINVSKTLYQ